MAVAGSCGVAFEYGSDSGNFQIRAARQSQTRRESDQERTIRDQAGQSQTKAIPKLQRGRETRAGENHTVE